MVAIIIRKLTRGIDEIKEKGLTDCMRELRAKTHKFINIVALLTAILMLTSTAAATSATQYKEYPKVLVPIGRTAGIKLFSDGVLIVGISKIPTDKGDRSPAGDAGLKPGDIIVGLDSKKVTSVEDLRSILQSKSSNRLQVEYIRSGKKEKCYIQPAVSSEDGTRKLGAWVRDSMAGIGTLTFYDPQTGKFGALGHGINDVDTSALMPLAKGTLIMSRVVSVRPGEAGSPGELIGEFDVNREFGTLVSNTEFGVFGTMDISALKPIRGAMPVADISEIVPGKATILANVDGDNIQEYEIRIKKLYPSDDNSIRDMIIEITDPRLLAKTGGIVQGMSGSPIFQNGKIVGAVTHVLINDPVRGYGIYIQKMLRHAYND